MLCNSSDTFLLLRLLIFLRCRRFLSNNWLLLLFGSNLHKRHPRIHFRVTTSRDAIDPQLRKTLWLASIRHALRRRAVTRFFFGECKPVRPQFAFCRVVQQECYNSDDFVYGQENLFIPHTKTLSCESSSTRCAVVIGVRRPKQSCVGCVCRFMLSRHDMENNQNACRMDECQNRFRRFGSTVWRAVVSRVWTTGCRKNASRL